MNRGAPGWWRRERPSHQISNYAPWTPPRVFLSRPKYNTPRETRKHRHVRNQLPGDPRADTGSGGRRVEVRKFPLSPCAAQTGRERRWKRRYDMRHQCQEILPGLLLGPFQVSKDLASLKELGISHMYASCPPRPPPHQNPELSLFACPAPRVCIRDVKEAFSVRPRFPGCFEYLVLDVQDSEEQNLIRLFPRSL